MHKNKYKLFLIRLLLIYILHLVIKWGDETFHDFGEFTTRGIFFSVYIISLWMLALYILDFLKKKLLSLRRSVTLYISFYLIFGYIFALLTNIGYRYIDTHFYGTDWGDIGYFNPTLIFGILAIFLSIVGFYEYFQTEIRSKQRQLLNQKLEKENAVAHYKLLKAQIEPHFLFNSLSVLNSLVYIDQDIASDFIFRLSKILRYSIEQNDRTFVSLKEEINYIDNYIFLMENRFVKSIYMQNEIEAQLFETAVLPPSSIQVLLENAIKHNSFNENNPLLISLKNDSEYLYVENTLRPKTPNEKSTGTGIFNLSQRFQHLCAKDIIVTTEESLFRVALPIILKNRIHESAYIRG